MTRITYGSTKTYTHAVGLSCCFRQWRAQSHCNKLHGYALEVKATFEANELDLRNWVMDFGGFSEFKRWLTEMFDHTTLVAQDDPHMSRFVELNEAGLIDMRVVDNTGCEAFARMIWNWLEAWLQGFPATKERVWLQSVEVREHGANSAYVRRQDVQT